jgi:phosphohistidine phosphatase SixA
MNVTIDSQTLAAEQLGLTTVGDVLGHVRAQNRLVTHVLIDGHQPDLGGMTALRQRPLLGHTVYIETAEPRRIATDVIDELGVQMDEAERTRVSVVDHLAAGDTSLALGKLSGCFTVWHAGQQAVEQVAQLLRIDLARISAGDATLVSVLDRFTQQLRTVRTSLEERDYVVLSDTLEYEIAPTLRQWREALAEIRTIVD